MNPIRHHLVKILFICFGVLAVAVPTGHAVFAQGTDRSLATGIAKEPLSYAELAVNPGIDADLQSLDESMKFDGESTKERQTRDRMVAIGLIGGTLLALLGVAFGYLRLDHATRGFYCGRLQMLAVACSVSILAFGYFLWTQVLFK